MAVELGLSCTILKTEHLESPIFTDNMVDSYPYPVSGVAIYTDLMTILAEKKPYYSTDAMSNITLQSFPTKSHRVNGRNYVDVPVFTFKKIEDIAKIVIGGVEGLTLRENGIIEGKIYYPLETKSRYTQIELKNILSDKNTKKIDGLTYPIIKDNNDKQPFGQGYYKFPNDNIYLILEYSEDSHNHKIDAFKVVKKSIFIDEKFKIAAMKGVNVTAYIEKTSESPYPIPETFEETHLEEYLNGLFTQHFIQLNSKMQELKMSNNALSCVLLDRRHLKSPIFGQMIEFPIKCKPLYKTGGVNVDKDDNVLGIWTQKRAPSILTMATDSMFGCKIIELDYVGAAEEHSVLPVYSFEKIEDIAKIVIGGVEGLTLRENGIKEGKIYYPSKSPDKFLSAALIKSLEEKGAIKLIKEVEYPYNSIRYHEGGQHGNEGLFRYYQFPNDKVYLFFKGNKYCKACAFQVQETPVFIDENMGIAIFEALIPSVLYHTDYDNVPDCFEDTNLGEFLNGPYTKNLIRLQSKMQELGCNSKTANLTKKYEDLLMYRHELERELSIIRELTTDLDSNGGISK